MVLVLLVMFAIRGVLRGTIAQVFAFVGIVLGVWAAALLADWVGAHWRAARPAIVFLVLRWVVAVLAGCAIASLFQWWGDVTAKAAHDGPFGWLDRLVGGAVGIAIGLVFVTLLTLAGILVPGLGFARQAAVHGVSARPLMSGGERVSAQVRMLPGALWLHEQFARARRQLAPRRTTNT